MSTLLRPADLLQQMASAARAKYATASEWASASGLPKETLSRLRSKSSCDLRTLVSLADAAGCTLVAVPRPTGAGEHLPKTYGRDHEDNLLDLCASGNADPNAWRATGPAFFMGGLAVLLAGARGFERERYLRLAEALHPGVSTPEVFATWLKQSPVKAARFLPMVRRRKGVA